MQPVGRIKVSIVLILYSKRPLYPWSATIEAASSHPPPPSHPFPPFPPSSPVGRGSATVRSIRPAGPPAHVKYL